MNQAEKTWSLVLQQLSCRMTKPTLDTWVRPCTAGEWDEDRAELTIRAPNALTADWLADRLKTTLNRELVGITARGDAHVRITIDDSPPRPELDEPQPPDRPSSWVKFYEFDLMKRGFLQVPKYVEKYWQPLLGSDAYNTWRFLRCLDKQNEGWGPWRKVSIRRIADTVADGNRQRISGVRRKHPDGTTYRQKGALDILSEAGIIKIKRVGKTRSRCLISCLNSLPLLTPLQVAQLTETLQWYHEKELEEARLEQEEWEQIEPESLVQK